MMAPWLPISDLKGWFFCLTRRKDCGGEPDTGLASPSTHSLITGPHILSIVIYRDTLQIEIVQ